MLALRVPRRRPPSVERRVVRERFAGLGDDGRDVVAIDEEGRRQLPVAPGRVGEELVKGIRHSLLAGPPFALGDEDVAVTDVNSGRDGLSLDVALCGPRLIRAAVVCRQPLRQCTCLSHLIDDVKESVERR